MKLYRTSPYYNPFYINEYRLNKIHIYNDTGIIASTRQGWFEGKGNNNSLDSFEVGETKRKLKPSFKLDHTYYISVRDKYSKDKTAELYIHESLFEWVDNVMETINHDTYAYHLYYKVTKDGFKFKIRTKEVVYKKHRDNKAFIDKVKRILDLAGHNDNISTYKVIENRRKLSKLIV